MNSTAKQTSDNAAVSPQDAALIWSPGRGGFARLGGISIPLEGAEPPRIGVFDQFGAALSLCMIEYVPAAGIATIRERHEGGRPMTDKERSAAEAYLRRVCDPAHSTPEARLP